MTMSGFGESEGDGHAESNAGERFAAEWSQTSDLWSAPLELLPTRLAGVCERALPVDGAGLSILSGEHRVPLGSTDEVVTRAEQLQFTVGEGPCLDTLRTRNPVQVDSEAMQQRWPLFYDQLTADTPFRSIIAVPIDVSAGVAGALDLYFRDPKAAGRFDIIDSVVVATQIGSLLRFASSAADESEPAGPRIPAWMYGPSADQRLRVWIASGLVMAHAKIDGPDALTLLRAFAYAEALSINDLADQIIEGTLPVERFTL